jgi:hypothetical protein
MILLPPLVLACSIPFFFLFLKCVLRLSTIENAFQVSWISKSEVYVDYKLFVILIYSVIMLIISFFPMPKCVLRTSTIENAFQVAWIRKSKFYDDHELFVIQIYSLIINTVATFTSAHDFKTLPLDFYCDSIQCLWSCDHVTESFSFTRHPFVYRFTL